MGGLQSKEKRAAQTPIGYLRTPGIKVGERRTPLTKEAGEEQPQGEDGNSEGVDGNKDRKCPLCQMLLGRCR